ncbi:MAG: NTP transferase domain-containing protein [Ignavibacteria bacterium]|nr:NTP transferase domain-containing protein [Ignavibacteria bacterium]
MKIVSVVMAGGLGTRLWPRSTEKKPKQFVHVHGNGTLIQNTVARMLPLIAAEDLFVVATQPLTHHIHDQLPIVPTANVIEEPFGRNTGPCIALAAHFLNHLYGPDAVMVAMPSDHVVVNVREFLSTLEQACVAADATANIVTIGVSPTRDETGFGYIQVGDELSVPNKSFTDTLHKVKTFAEKPDSATAQRFIDAGDFVWNSGIFVARISTMLAAIDKHLPDHAPLFNILEKHVGKDTYSSMLENVYRQMRSISFDNGVMEKAKNIAVVDGTFGWSDVGSWDELYRLSMKDGKNNVIEGNVVTMNSDNNFVTAATGKLISLINVDNLIVVETESSILIAERGSSAAVRDLVDLIRRRHIGNHL